MLRRTLLTGAGALLAAPALGQPAATRAAALRAAGRPHRARPGLHHRLRHAPPRADGLGPALRPGRAAPAAAADGRGHEVEDDGLTLDASACATACASTMASRCAARDCIASIRRWAQRDALGQVLLARVGGDGGARRPQLHHPAEAGPSARCCDALGKIGPPRAVHHAGAHRRDRRQHPDPRDHRQRPLPLPGRTSAWSAPASSTSATRTTCPRPDGTPSWAAGPKLVHFDRVEWPIMPDPGTAAAALRNGEVDWWENPPNDLLPLLRRDRDIAVEARQPARAPSAPASSTTCIRPSTSRRSAAPCCGRCARPIS